MRRAVPQGPSLQHCSNHHVLLDNACGPVHPLRLYIQDSLRYAKEERGQAAEDAIDGRSQRGRDVRNGGTHRWHRNIKDTEHSFESGQTESGNIRGRWCRRR